MTFRGPLAVPYDAHFRVIEGELFLGRDGSFEGAKGYIAIKTASVKSKKAEHQKMLWRDVFEAFAYPEIELRVSSIKPGGEPGSRKRRREKDWHLSARGELGLFGFTIPEEYGGSGMDEVSYAIVMEELSVGWMSVAGILGTHMMTAWMRLNPGTVEQKKTYLPKMATGEWHSGMALTESGSGSESSCADISLRF